MLQEADLLCRRLGWHRDAGGGHDAELDEDQIVLKIQAVYARALYAHQGKVVERDSKKPFIPDWKAAEPGNPVQAVIVKQQVSGFLVRSSVSAPWLVIQHFGSV